VEEQEAGADRRSELTLPPFHGLVGEEIGRAILGVYRPWPVVQRVLLRLGLPAAGGGCRRSLPAVVCFDEVGVVEQELRHGVVGGGLEHQQPSPR
jgi:hypothetical protein